MRKFYIKSPAILFLLGAATGLIFACSDPEFERQRINNVPLVRLKDAWMIDPYRHLPEYKFTLSKRNIFQIPAGETDLHTKADIVKYHVSLQKLEYTTTYKGQEITASGLIILPITPDVAPPIVSFHHGAIFAERNVPTNLTLTDSLENLANFHILPALVLAANGFITFVPDYIGHGSSSHILHPDHLYQPPADAVIDMLLAGREFLKEEEILFDENKLFLAGYSEGGYVTMAAHKAIEERPELGLPLTASAPGGGNYNLSLDIPEIGDSNVILMPNSFSRRIVAWNEYDFNRPLTDFFQEPYATHVSHIFKGEFDFNETNEYLTSHVPKLLNHDFLMRIEKGEEKEINDALLANSLTNWRPKVPLRIYKGTFDKYETAQEEYDIIIKKHMADPAVVVLVPLENQNHFGAAYPYLAEIIKWFHTF